MPLLCVQCGTSDDGQRNCPKHVEFYSKNKFEKLMHLVGFIVRIITMHGHLNVNIYIYIYICVCVCVCVCLCMCNYPMFLHNGLRVAETCSRPVTDN